MKLAHLADLHLGFRQYYRQNAQGINQREADVTAAFRRAFDAVTAARPDLIVIAGDLFHSVRPTNLAILEAFARLRILRESLPESPIVIIAGDHDTPRAVETGSILKLFEAVEGVYTVTHEVRELVLEALDCTVLCVPHAALAHRPTLVPQSRARFNVLLMHGRLQGMVAWESASPEYADRLIEPGELHAESWSYVALGDYHVAHQVRENAWFSGALDYVGTNPWGQLADEARQGRPGKKGWLLVDLADGARVEFRPVELARRVIDLEPVHAAGLGAEEIDAAIAQRVGAVRGGIADQIVRQLVYDVPRPVVRDLDHARIREWKAHALHFHLDLRRPLPARDVGVGAPGRRQTLPEIVIDYLSRRPLDADVDRDKLVALGRTYMDQVERELAED